MRSKKRIVNFDAADNFWPVFHDNEAMNVQNDNPSIPTVNFKDHDVLVFDLTSMQDATENCQYPGLVGEQLRLELNITFLPEHVTKLIELGDLMSSVSFHIFGLVGKNIWNGHCFPPANNQPYLAPQVSVPWFNSLLLCSRSSWWDLCHYKYATQQNVGWALDKDFKLSSHFVFCRLSRKL